MSTVTGKPGKESLITILTLLKSFYDEEVFSHLTREIYNSDIDISLTAIRSSAVIGNESAVSHLHTMIEKGKLEQKIAALQALAVIRAPSSVARLVKYFSLFSEIEIRVEIIKTLTAIGPTDEKFRDLVVNLAQDTHLEEEIRIAASDAVAALQNIDVLLTLKKTTSGAIKKNIVMKALHLPVNLAAEIFHDTTDAMKTLDHEGLGYFLAGYLLFSRQPDQKAIVGALTGKMRPAAHWFLQALLERDCEISQPLRMFKTLLIIPYLNREAEKLVGKNLERIIDIMKERSPFVLNELGTITAAHLEAISGKIKKNFLSLGSIQQKEGLISLLFARLIENYATPTLLDDVQRYFKGNRAIAEEVLIRDIRRALIEASDEENNQLKVCLVLFNPNRKADQLKTQTMLSNVDLARPALLRRLNRFVRLAGMLGIKSMIKNLQRILEFARSERIVYLEETTIVSLCQLYDKPSLDRAAAVFKVPQDNIPSLKGYVRGLRFCLPPLYLKELAELVLNQRVASDVKLMVLETFGALEIKQAKGVTAYLVKALFLPKRDVKLFAELEKQICRLAGANAFQVLLGFLSHNDKLIRLLAVRALWEIAGRDSSVPREVLINRFYLLLEEEDKDVKQEALIALLYLKDDYAIQVFGDYFKQEHSGDVPTLLMRLPQPLTRDVAQFLFHELCVENTEIQNTLRSLFAAISKGDLAEELRNVLLDYLGNRLGKVINFSPSAAVENDAGLLEQAKIEFKFKRENSQILTVFFCDIVSYTEKTSLVNTSSLMKLIRSFEGIVFPVIREYRGQIVKTLGDGILAAFKHPLNAALAAISVQKKVTEHNQYKVDDEKFFLRVGLNTGLVIRKQNDIFGDVVNIASRMQAAANPGDVLLTHDTFAEIQNYIKCTPLGKIKVKGKEEAIAAYAAQELKVDFNHLVSSAATGAQAARKGANVDPITNLKESMFTPVFTVPDALSLGRSLLGEVEKLFSSMTQAVEELAKDYHEEFEFKKYLQKRWDHLVKHWDRHLTNGNGRAGRAVSS